MSVGDPFRREVETLPEQFLWEPEARGRLAGEAPLVIGGMGGSALAGDFLALRLEGRRPVTVVRDEVLPPGIAADAEVLCISCSGNTGETLALREEALARGHAVAAIASGGELLERTRAADAVRCAIPGGLSPRSSLGYMIRAGLAVVGVEDREGPAVAEHLTGIRERWVEPGLGEQPAEAFEVAWLLHGTLPVLASVEAHTAVAARRWAADLAENAKMIVATWGFPEAAHNQIMAYAFPGDQNLRPVLLTLGEVRHPARRRRWEVTEQLLRDRGATLRRVADPHPDPWIEALGLAYLGDWVSVLLAEFEGLPAADLNLMNELKARLRQPE